jgi:hypothetical protein
MSGQYQRASAHEMYRTTLPTLPRSLAVRGVGALLCVGVSVIHVLDQGGFPGSKQPAYVGILFYILEIAGVAAAMVLLAGFARLGWSLSLGVSAGPIVGYVLSRGPGLPNYTDDIGNWAEPLGVCSLIVEAVLFTLAITMLSNALRRGKVGSTGR